ncbi:MAG: trehalose-6-phosphate synthase [Flavobacteriales bacterium]|nr:trehalose-6-phosphate synthase [Flavobacteriales bacterium]
MTDVRSGWGLLNCAGRRLSKFQTTDALLADGRYEVHPVALPDTTRDRHYNGFSNGTLWPLFHYFPRWCATSRIGSVTQEANRLFWERWRASSGRVTVCGCMTTTLCCCRHCCANISPDLAIAFFLHIPFPSYEIFRLLPDPWRRALLEGMLGADLIGMQTHDNVQYLLKSVQRFSGFWNSTCVRCVAVSTVVDAFPVSIDPARFRDTFDDHAVVAAKNLLRKDAAGRRIVLSIDRLDYTKGGLQRLHGFERMLEQDPELIGKVTYLMIIIPSRDAITKYRELKERIEATVGRINGRFGDVDWQPVVYQYRSVDHKKLCAIYQAAEVALVTPLRDGMNLIAKEYVAARKDRRGVLVLSETAGAANELGGALIINPSDPNAIAAALVRALEMPAQEQAGRMAQCNNA